MRREAFPFLAVALAACAQVALAAAAAAGPHDALIVKHAAANGVPEQLVHRIIRIESRGNASAAHGGNYGLMQIRLATARGVGYSGEAEGLLDPDTNLTYAVKYLAAAYRAAGCDADRAVSYYRRGYYGAPQLECGSNSSALVQVAQAETKPEGKAARKREKAAAKRKPDAVPAASADVIKPKVVRTETIAPSKSGPVAARPVGTFEPARVALPPAQPAAAARPAAATAKSDMLKPDMLKHDMRKPDMLKPDRPESDLLKPVAPEPAAEFELASVPLPPVRPEVAPAPKQDVQPAARSKRKHARADKKPEAKANTKTKSKADTKSTNDTKSGIDDPVGVISFFKKLVTPDNKPR